MGIFAPVTDADLARARKDRTFRQRLLEDNLEALLVGMKKLRKQDPAIEGNTRQLREGVELAVRLAEIIQNAARPRGF